MMIGKKIQAITGLLIISFVLLFSPSGKGAYSSVDAQLIKVGLFFNYNRPATDNAVSNFTVSSALNGISLGLGGDNKFISLYEESSASPINIRKDVMFAQGLTGLREIYSGEITNDKKIGPYHIKIGSNFHESVSATQKKAWMEEKGVLGYIAYISGEWQVWTGSYVNQSEAEQDIEKIREKLGNENYTVTLTSSSRIIASLLGRDIFAFDSTESGAFQICPSSHNNPEVIKINEDANKVYRGKLQVLRQASSDLTVINILPLEQYLYGVVPCEVSSNFHGEALKAQAVAARNYALGNIGKYGILGFDLCSTQFSQAYAGYSKESAPTNRAVDQTSGKKLVYNNKLASVFFFSVSGGRTEDSENVWSQGIPYLRGVIDNYEPNDAPYREWEKKFTAVQLKDTLSRNGCNVGDVTSIRVSKTSAAGRTTELIVTGTDGSKTLKNEKCRTVLGLRSQWYEIQTSVQTVQRTGISNNRQNSENISKYSGENKLFAKNDLKDYIIKEKNNVTEKSLERKNFSYQTEYTFKGKGWGHAVGMSQYGAKGMAEAGFTYEDILKHYFSGVEIQ